MAMITLEKETADIIEQCTEFLGKSSRRYSKPLTRATNDLRRYSGNFWDDELRKQYRRGKKRTCLQLNNWNVMCNAIASPLSSSPWHTELKNKEGEFKQIQDAIDQLEAKSDVKTALLDAFRKAVLTGYGFLVISTDVDEYTGEPTIVVESVKHLQSVALDPSCVTVSGIDAEEGAVVNFISLKRARRLYGEEVAPFDYPAAQPKLSLNGMEQWGCPEDQIAIVSYYVKENDGVHFYKICGDKVVQDAFLPIKHIPIIRLAGNEIYNNENIDYNGLVQMTMSLELGANIAYSTLIERCGRSTKANYLINVDAIDGLERNYAQANDDDAAAVLWKGEHQPLPLVEQFQTGDLQAVVTTTRTLMEDVVGVPLTGIPDGTPEKTATEVLRQQTSKESNTAQYYNNAFAACNHMSKVVIELLNGGVDLRYSLENGPSVITRQLKARQELSALSAMCPDEMKGVLAVFFAKTLEDDVGEAFCKNMIANLPPNVQYIDDQSMMDPIAAHQMEQMKLTLDESMMQLNAAVQQNAELQKQLDAANLSLMENREQRVMEWNRFIVQEQDKMALESAKLQQSGEVDEAKLQLESAKLIQKAETEQVKEMRENDKALFEMQQKVDGARREGQQEGYEQGVNDGVDAAFGG